MWLATKHGFYSIVKKSEGYHVRARVHADLVTLKSEASLPGKIQSWPEADYRYRLIVGVEDVERLFAILCAGIDYPNFKSEIAASPSQRAKLSSYHRIWHEMATHQKA